MFNGYILHFYPLNELISNLMPATGLKKVDMGATKVWKSNKFLIRNNINKGFAYLIIYSA